MNQELKMDHLESLRRDIKEMGVELSSFALWSVDEHGFQCLSLNGTSSAKEAIDIVRRTYLGNSPYIEINRVCLFIKQTFRYSLLCLIDSDVPFTHDQFDKIQKACDLFGESWVLPTTDLITQPVKQARLISGLFNHIATEPDVLSDSNSVQAFATQLKELTSCPNIIIVKLNEEKTVLFEAFYEDEKDPTSFPMDVESAFVSGSISAFVAKFGKPIRGNSRDLLRGIGVNADDCFGQHCEDMIGVPIKYDQEIYGVIIVQSYEKGFQFDEQIASAISLMSDSIGARIHDRKTQERLNAIIANQTVELTNNNNQLKRTIEELVSTRADLIDTQAKASLTKIVLKISHYLNTPLGNAGLSSSVMVEALSKIKDAVGNSDRASFNEHFESLEHALKISNDSIKRSVEIVREFKKLSVEQGFFTISEFTTEELFAELKIQSMKKLTNKNIRLNFQGTHQPVYSYFTAIIDVLMHLVNNSLQHAFANASQGNITLNSRVTEDLLILEYLDDGAGVDESAREHLFDLFESASEYSERMGLGLAIVDGIVRVILKGNIAVISSKSRSGLGFMMTIPLIRPTNYEQ